ncbi:MAG TPA: hypothetical protein VK124_09275 [Gemmatimonadales bacterium]|nr:hypothetical protein [Gemmatimonadales bacterium]
MLRIAVLAFTVALGSTSGAIAQRGDATSRDGSRLWYGFGVAPGWARVSCAICAANRPAGISAFAAIGGSTSRVLRIAGELAAWRERDGTVRQTLMSVGAAAYWYPNIRRRFYLKGGVAYVMHRASDGTVVITSSGIGPQMGVGYQYPFSRDWLVGPFFHYSVGVIGGDVKYNGGQAASSARVSFLQVGLSLTRR